MSDRTTKFLLILIAIALWGLLLRPALAPTPTHAAEAAAPSGFGGPSGGTIPFPLPATPRFDKPVVLVHPATGQLYVVDNSGYMYSIDPVTLDINRSTHLVPKR
jgi:hypothetical protein